MLDFLVHALQRPRVAGLSLPKPELKFRWRVLDIGSQSDVGRLDAVLVDVNVEVLNERWVCVGVGDN
jgi:hypothetical protein